MKRNKYRKIKLKKKHLWVTILWFLITTFILFVLMQLSFALLVGLTIETKLSEELDNVSKMAVVYEENYDDKANDGKKTDNKKTDDNKSGGKKSDEKKENDPLYEYDVEYFVTGDDGGLLERTDGASFDAEKGYSFTKKGDEVSEFKIYSDIDDVVISPNGDDSVSINYFELLKQLKNEMDENDAWKRLFADADFSVLNTQVKLPIWVSTVLNNDSERLYVKTEVSVSVREIMPLVFVQGIVFAIYMVVFIVFLVSAIRNTIANRRMTRTFFTDVVTGGRNKIWFFIKGDHTIKKRTNAKKKYTIISVELVKYLNFCVCHSISEGERLLCAIFESIIEEIGKKNMCVHHDSADFAVLVEMTDEISIKEIAEKIMFAAKSASGYDTAFQVGAYLIDIETDETGKIRRRMGADLEEYYNNARTARATLAESDDSGIAYFDEIMIEEQRWENTVHERQQAALDNEEFQVYYQPKYDPRADTLRGAEALIRWQSPEFGFVTPNRFIPIFEKNGFITQIDHYMIAHVARDQKRWLDQGKKCVPVSVNVSRMHFIEPDLAEQIRDIVDSAGTPHELIEIELTESAFFDDKKAMLKTIKNLKEYGFSVSMDDFGSGYSSLNSLKDMPLDVLKLDAEFFRGDNVDDRGRIVVEEAIKLARKLNMRTVAEGVEVKEQVDFLAEQECDMIQGYYYAKPMPAGDFEKAM